MSLTPSIPDRHADVPRASTMRLEELSGVRIWATQILVADLTAEVESRMREGTFRKLNGPPTTRGVLLEDDRRVRVFLFPRDLAPYEPAECQLFYSDSPLSELNSVLREHHFSCGKIDSTCPWGPFMEVTSPTGERSYLYNLLEAFRPTK